MQFFVLFTILIMQVIFKYLDNSITFIVRNCLNLSIIVFVFEVLSTIKMVLIILLFQLIMLNLIVSLLTIFILLFANYCYC